MTIQRIASFKVPKPSDVEDMLLLYDTLRNDNQKDGKPYILEVKARKNYDDPRNQGYTLVCMTKYASIDDMIYYDEECPGHKKLKESAKGKINGPPLLFDMEE